MWNIDSFAWICVVCGLFSDPSFPDYSDDVERLLGAYTKDKGKAGLESALSEYTSLWSSSPSQETIKKTIVEIGTDYIFLVPTQAALYLHASNARWEWDVAILSLLQVYLKSFWFKLA